jgi:hypothetical protein
MSYVQTASRKRLRTVRERAAATRFARSLHRGRALATHLIAAGVEDAETVKGTVSGLRTVAKRLGVTPVKVTRAHRTVDGKAGRTQRTHHYTTAQVLRIAEAYKPRKAEYRAARVLLLANAGAPVVTRQALRPVRVLVNA